MIDATHRPLWWLVAAAGLWALNISWLWQPGSDDVGYLSLARSIANGSPRMLGSTALHYPIGYPLLISPFFWFSDRPFLLLSIFHALVAAAAIVGIHRWAKRVIPEGALVVALFVAVNFAFWYYGRRFLSELPFIALLAWSAVALQRVVDAQTRAEILKRAAIAAVLLVAVSMVRQIGVFLVIGFALVVFRDIWRGRETFILLRGFIVPLILGLPASVVIIALIIWYRRMTDMAGPDEKDYLEWLAFENMTLFEQVSLGVQLRISEVGRLIMPGLHKAPGRLWNASFIAYILATMLVAYGWVRLAMRTRDPFVMALPFIAAFYVVWAFDQGTRYFLPLLPVLAASLYMVIEPFARHRLSFFAVILFMHVVVTVPTWWMSLDDRAAWHGHWPTFEAFAERIEQEPGDIGFVTDDSDSCHMMSFAADRPVVEIDPDRMLPLESRWLIVGRDHAEQVLVYDVVLEHGDFVLMRNWRKPLSR